MVRAHPDTASVLTLVLLSFLMFAPALVPGKVVSPADILFLSDPWKSLAPGLEPANPLLSDVAYLFQPWLIYAAGEIRQGRFPLWNPHVFAGSPFFANPQSALLFPLNWAAFILPMASALTLIAILKVAATGVAMYVFLRVRALHPLAALMGSVSFMLSGLLVVWLQWSYASTLLFFPLLLAGVEHLRARGGGRPMALLALAVAVDAFAGYPQGLALGLVSASAWALYRARGAGARFLASCAAAVGLGLGLASVQLLPFIEYARHSAVLSNRSEWLPPMHASLRSAVNLLMPYYYGGPTGGDYWGEWNFNETSASVGLAPWLLLPVALLSRRRAAGFFGLMALGAGALFYGLGGDWMSTGVFIINFRLAALLVFALCVLGALGMDALLSEPRRLSAWLPASVRIGFGALVAVAFLSFGADYATMARGGVEVAGSLRYLCFLALATACAALVLRGIDRGGSAWALGLIAVELVSVAPLAATYNTIIDTRLLYPAPPAVAHLQDAVTRAAGRVLMPANLSMLYGLNGVAGYDGMTPRRIDEVIGSAGDNFNFVGNGHLAEVPIFQSPARDLLGIRHVLVPPGVRLEAAGLSLEHQGDDGRIYGNGAALPRALVVPRARCADDGQALRLIRERQVDFRREAILAGCATVLAAASGPSTATAVIERDAPELVVIAATSDRPGYLVLTDTWFPGWSARVDGRAVPIERANHAFRAVRIEPGRHEVEFRYRPDSVRYGLAASALAAAITLALAWRSRPRPSAGQS